MCDNTNLKNALVISVFFVATTCNIAAGKVIYVDDDVPPGGNGQNWTRAYQFLQDALTDANSSGKPVEIRIARGVYTPDSNSAEPNGSGNRKATFQLQKGVILKGGYAGFYGPEPNSRDIVWYESVLSGDLKGNDREVSDPCDLLNDPCRAENSYHVVNGKFTDPNVVINGFTITGGNANGSFHELEGWGGGMYNLQGSPTLVNCTFIGNSSRLGGGLYNYTRTKLTLTNCTFTGNSAANRGGGMYNNEHSKVKLTNCRFIGNWARTGGGMGSGVVSYATVTNCIFTGNRAELWGGGMYNTTELTLANSVFSGNSARSRGGGMHYAATKKSTVTNCTFIGNAARYGGGIYMESSSGLTLTNCILWANEAADEPEIYFKGQVSGGLVKYTAIRGGWLGDDNIDADPRFVELGHWEDRCNTPDNPWDDFWIDGDYNLLPDSPCIDSGDPNDMAEPNETDLHCKPHIIGGRIDMGAYEYSP